MIQKAKAKGLIEFISEKSNKLVYILDKNKKNIRYFILAEDGETKPYDEILFNGFEKLPSGVYSEGYGFTTGGWLLDKYLKETFGDKFKLVISAIESSSVKKIGKIYTVTFNFKEFKRLQERLREIKAERNKESENATKYFLHKFFPKHFTAPEDGEGSVYNSGSVAGLLTKDKIIENLSSQDVKALDEFYPEFYRHSNKKLSSEKRLYKITKDKQEAEVVYLENIITEFEKNLHKACLKVVGKPFCVNTYYYSILITLTLLKKPILKSWEQSFQILC